MGGLSSSNALKRAVLLVVFAPPVALILLVIRYHYDAPWWDTWHMAALVKQSFEGTLTFANLWANYNEHRIIVPALIMLANARVFGWNHLVECLLTIGFAVGFMCVLVNFIRESSENTCTIDAILIISLLSVIVFSPNQWQLWLWGWLHAIYLNLLCAAAMIYALTRPQLTWRHVTVAAVLGLVATFSFAAGLVLWIVAGVLLLVRGSGRNAWSLRAAWLLLTVAVFFGYFWEFQFVDEHPATTEAFRRPLVTVAYVAIYLGGPVFSFESTGAMIAGFVALGVFAWTLLATQQRRSGLELAQLVWIAFAVYALGAAAMTAIGRVGFGTEQALSSRYFAFANLLWIADAALLSTLLNDRPKWLRSILAALAVFVLANWGYGAYQMDERHDAFREARDELLRNGASEELLQRLTPLPSAQRETLIDFLREERLSLFRSVGGDR